MSMKNTKNIINRYLGPAVPMEEKLFTMGAFGTLLVEVTNLIGDILMDVQLVLLIIAAAVCLLSVIVTVVTYKTKAFITGYTVICVLINVVLMPAVFIFCGGFRSGCPIYMILGFVLCGCHPSRKSGMLTTGVSAAVYAMTFVLAIWKPEMIQPLPEDMVVLDVTDAVLLGAIMVVSITSLYLTSYKAMYEKNLKDYEQKTEMRMALLESQIENIEDVKRQRHNMRHHNRIIGEFAEKHDLKGLRNYLREKQYSDEFYSKRLYCMNVEINNILTIYDRLALNKGVTMIINADVKSEVKMDESELLNMISTVLENAINGAMTSGREQKTINLEIRERGRRLVLNCRNTCALELKEMDEYPGFPGNGIEAVEEVLDSVGGILDYRIDSGEVVCRLIVDAF